MPFALVIIGLIFVITGVKGTVGAMGSQIKEDFTGPGNFFYWFAAIGSIGALGAVPEFRTFSRTFMALILIAMIIRNGGVFDNLLKAISEGPIAPTRDATSSAGENSGLFGNLAKPGSMLVPGATIGNAVVGAVKSLASKSIDTSAQQQSNPAQNAGALAKVLGFFF